MMIQQVETTSLGFSLSYTSSTNTARSAFGRCLALWLASPLSPPSLPWSDCMYVSHSWGRWLGRCWGGLGSERLQDHEFLGFVLFFWYNDLWVRRRSECPSFNLPWMRKLHLQGVHGEPCQESGVQIVHRAWANGATSFFVFLFLQIQSKHCDRAFSHDCIQTYVCMDVCTHICMCACMYVCMRDDVCIVLHHLSPCAAVGTTFATYVYMDVRTHICMHACIHVCGWLYDVCTVLHHLSPCTAMETFPSMETVKHKNKRRLPA